MLLRFVAENFLSFKEAAEINTIASSKSRVLRHHCVKCGHTHVLRLNAIYGANGAGKSNLVKALNFLKNWMMVETLEKATVSFPFYFKMDKACATAHTAFTVDYLAEDHIYSYRIEFDNAQIYYEKLLRKGKYEDHVLFIRNDSDIQWWGEGKSGKLDAPLLDAILRMLRMDMPLLLFMGRYYPELSFEVSAAYRWFTDNLSVEEPTSFPEILPHLFDILPLFAEKSKQLFAAIDKGIVSLGVKKVIMDENVENYHSPMREAVDFAMKHPHIPYSFEGPLNGNLVNVVYEDNQLVKKTMTITHLSADGEPVEFDYAEESDGIRHFMEYLSMLHSLSVGEVYVVDDIERSIHPVLMKKIMEIIANNEDIKGQLIFTAHESNLLDQSLLRPDEIWLAEKNEEQATEFYRLSDYKVHHTANLQNRYLEGRYGGVPIVDKLDKFHK